jgi:hypothetical protein
MSDRLADPTGKRALFSATTGQRPEDPAAEDSASELLPSGTARPGAPTEGRAALFSTPGRSGGTVVVECSDCKVRSRVSLVNLAVQLSKVSVWLPFGRNQHWMLCPACGQRRWCRIGWLE